MLVETAGDTTAEYRTDRIDEGQRHYCERVAVYTSTTDNADCLVCIEGAGDEFPLYYFKDITNGEWSSQPIRVWLFEGENLLFKWSGIVATETQEMAIHGNKRFEN